MNTIYYNGSIITMDTPDGASAIQTAPEAVWVKNGLIFGSGKLADLEKKAGEKAKKIDLDGKCLMPSFIDPHSHVAMNGQLALCADLGACESFQDIIDTLKAYIKEKKIKSKGAVLGFGYDHNFLEEQAHPDKRVLDQVSTEIPIFILHVSAHLGCVNSKALELAGVTSDTPNPEGGIFGRLEDGKEPSGYLEEGGMMALQAVVRKRMKINIADMFRGMQKTYIEHGVTTVQDGATTPMDFNLLKFMEMTGMLKIDVVSYPLMTNTGVDLLHKNKNRVCKYKKHLKIGGYKLVLDGSPQGKSAWMSQPYEGEEEYCGYPWMKDEEVEENIRIALQENQQLLAHCNGDAASEQFLTLYEKVSKEVRHKQDLRPVMIHCQTVRDDQLDRMPALGMIASVFVGHVFFWGDVHKKNFGEVRGNHVSPVKSALDRSICVNFHQDTPVTKPDMMHSVWTAVNRISRTGQMIGEDQKIDVYEALKAVTINGAYQYFEEDSKGSIEPGKRADLVILDRSPLETDPMELRDIKVLETIKDGVSIYKRI